MKTNTTRTTKTPHLLAPLMLNTFQKSAHSLTHMRTHTHTQTHSHTHSQTHTYIHTYVHTHTHTHTHTHPCSHTRTHTHMHTHTHTHTHALVRVHKNNMQMKIAHADRGALTSHIATGGEKRSYLCSNLLCVCMAVNRIILICLISVYFILYIFV